MRIKIMKAIEGEGKVKNILNPYPLRGGDLQKCKLHFLGGVGPKKCNHYILEVFLKM